MGRMYARRENHRKRHLKDKNNREELDGIDRKLKKQLRLSRKRRPKAINANEGLSPFFKY